mmetsp:Transcript_28857/g.87308  ORF Transcript_28857/g.87308 Transcript_28857/m.87308 type:complete len:214 (+) Transcript_28857:580-1221(+)
MGRHRYGRGEAAHASHIEARSQGGHAVQRLGHHGSRATNVTEGEVERQAEAEDPDLGGEQLDDQQVQGPERKACGEAVTHGETNDGNEQVSRPSVERSENRTARDRQACTSQYHAEERVRAPVLVAQVRPTGHGRCDHGHGEHGNQQSLRLCEAALHVHRAMCGPDAEVERATAGARTPEAHRHRERVIFQKHAHALSLALALNARAIGCIVA